MSTNTLSPAEIVLNAAKDAIDSTQNPLPPVRYLSDLKAPPVDDQEELLKNRFLSRGGGLLLVGPTGIGKSSFLMQAAISWAIGKPFYGICPSRPLTIWIIQGENDDGDLTEMRDGIIRGMENAKLASAVELQDACMRIRVITEDSVIGAEFGDWLNRMLKDTHKKPDLICTDPVFSFYGGDVSLQKDVSLWLRKVINPVIHQHHVGLILSHHTNKPQANNRDKIAWQNGELAYLGAGSAEWCNWARAVVALRPCGNHNIYELRAAKRGRRLGWRDADGYPKYITYAAHGAGEGIFWREPSQDEILQATTEAEIFKGRPRGIDSGSLAMQAIEFVRKRPLPVSEFRSMLEDRFMIGVNKAFEVCKLAIERGQLKKAWAKNGKQRYEIIGLPGMIESASDKLAF